ncbi:RNase H family protein [Nocardia wallacei]|uniref:RNase H family protein n=1 Tax=Nocardia wallacei TaxID=480035 RepID=UPI002458610F|nr:RNase H family protein [Nocardia wallacei]
MTAAVGSWPATHSAQPGRRYNGDRGVRGRIQVPGSTRLIVATDGSWKQGAGGFGYVTRNGHWALSSRFMKGRLSPVRDDGTASLVFELRAAGMVLEHFPGRAVRFLIDCEPAIRLLRLWQAGDVGCMPPGYSLRPRINGGATPALVRIAEIVSGRMDLRFTHVHAHRGHVMNEVADSLAGIGRRALGGELGDECAVAERASGLVEGFLHEIRGGAA